MVLFVYRAKWFESNRVYQHSKQSGYLVIVIVIVIVIVSRTTTTRNLSV